MKWENYNMCLTYVNVDLFPLNLFLNLPSIVLSLPIDKINLPSVINLLFIFTFEIRKHACTCTHTYSPMSFITWLLTDRPGVNWPASTREMQGNRLLIWCLSSGLRYATIEFVTDADNHLCYLHFFIDVLRYNGRAIRQFINIPQGYRVFLSRPSFRT